MDSVELRSMNLFSRKSIENPQKSFALKKFRTLFEMSAMPLDAVHVGNKEHWALQGTFHSIERGYEMFSE